MSWPESIFYTVMTICCTLLLLAWLTYMKDKS